MPTHLLLTSPSNFNSWGIATAVVENRVGMDVAPIMYSQHLLRNLPSILLLIQLTDQQLHSLGACVVWKLDCILVNYLPDAK